MTTRTYHSPNGGLAVAWRQKGTRNVFMQTTGMNRPKKCGSFRQAEVTLLALGYVRSNNHA